MHNSMAVVAWLWAMRLASVYTRADAQSYGSKCMALGSVTYTACIRWLVHRSMAVDAWLQSMRLVFVYTRADAQSYDSGCVALGHAFGVCVFAG